MYYLCVGSFVLTLLAVASMRRYRTGRVLIGVRENEANMQSFAVNVVRAKLTAFAISGLMCGFAGVLFAHHQRAVTVASFRAQASLDLFLTAVVGGISSVTGVALGTLYYATQDLVGSDRLSFLIGPPAIVALLYIYPSGLSGILFALRDGIYRIVAQRNQLVVPSLMTDYDPAALQHRLIPIRPPAEDSTLSDAADDPRYAPVSDLYLQRGRVVAGSRPSESVSEEASMLSAAVGSEE